MNKTLRQALHNENHNKLATQFNTTPGIINYIRSACGQLPTTRVELIEHLEERIKNQGREVRVLKARAKKSEDHEFHLANTRRQMGFRLHINDFLKSITDEQFEEINVPLEIPEESEQ